MNADRKAPANLRPQQRSGKAVSGPGTQRQAVRRKRILGIADLDAGPRAT
jgi:hypothetical protein